MARDFEDIHDIDNLGDAELRELVMQHLAAHNGLDIGDINVHVESGEIRLIGRVGTEAEARIAEHVVTDGLGIVGISNELVVDATRRAESPAAIDDHLADEEVREGVLLGDRAPQQSDEDAESDEDDDAYLFGTTDVQKTIERGTAWIPPESATPEGLGGTDSVGGEDH
jgi:hypothetical protein